MKNAHGKPHHHRYYVPHHLLPESAQRLLRDAASTDPETLVGESLQRSRRLDRAIGQLHASYPKCFHKPETPKE